MGNWISRYREVGYDERLKSVPRDMTSFLIELLIPVHLMEAENDESKARIFHLTSTWSSECDMISKLPIKEIVPAGSRAESLCGPAYMGRYDGTVKYVADTDLMCIVNTEEIPYEITIEEIPECTNFRRIKNSVSGHYIKHEDFVIYEDMIRQGPALTIDMAHGDQFEHVIAIPFRKWPGGIAEEWARRTRNGWPNKDTISAALEQSFCLVPVGRKNCPTFANEYRCSFSLAEVILAKSLTVAQRHAYILVKLFYTLYLKECEISTYCIKTIFFYLCESLQPHIWANDISFNIECILDKIIQVYSNKMLPHYFNTHFNLLSTITKEQADTVVDKVHDIRGNILKHVLLLNKQIQFRSIGCATKYPIIEFVPRLKDYLQDSHDQIDKIKNVCIDKYFKLCITGLHSCASKCSIPDSAEDMTANPNIFPLLQNFRAASSLMEAYLKCNPNISNTDILMWIIYRVLLLKNEFDPEVQSVSLALIVSSVNHNIPNVHIYTDRESLNDAKHALLEQHQLNRSSQLRICSIFYSLPILVKYFTMFAENLDEFVNSIWLFWLALKGTDSISRQIEHRSRQVMWHYFDHSLLE